MLGAVNAGSKIAAGFCDLGVEKGGGAARSGRGRGDGKKLFTFPSTRLTSDSVQEGGWL